MNGSKEDTISFSLGVERGVQPHTITVVDTEESSPDPSVPKNFSQRSSADLLNPKTQML